LDAYDAGGALLASNSLGPNYGSSSYLSVSDAQGRIKYVIIHDTSNYWSVDDLEYTLAAEVIITISATEPIIPRESRVENGRVLYQSTLTITARNTITQAPVAGLSIQVQSDRPQDTIIQPTEPTNDKGVAKARIQTREKGTATISGATSDISAAPVPTTIAFNDANYEQRFRLTLYVIADENDWGAPYVINPCGLTGTYSRTFLREVRENGSGRTSGGQYIQIDWLSGGPQGERTCYTVVPFPTTASGVLLEEGMTIAVDQSIIPTGSDVNIGGIGTRTAQDTGGAIVGYRIDLYVGVGETAMQAWEQWNLQWLTVRYVDP
jgi:3D (Asp-Asp-Asp) domain-containing protein